MPQTRWVNVGEIIKPHGLKGELKLRLETRADLQGQTVQLNGREFSVLSFRPTTANFAVAKLKGVDSPEQAEALRNAQLQVAAELLLANELLIDDLLALEVWEVGGNAPLGRVLSVENLPAQAVLRIQRYSSPNAEFLLPLIERYVAEIDLNEKRLLVQDWHYFTELD